MIKERLFANTVATNGLARGYGLRSHRRTRKGLRFAVVVLLLALAGLVYASIANAQKDEIIKFDTPTGFGEVVNISLCKQAIKDGHYLGEADGKWTSLAYYYDQALYVQTFNWGLDKKLTCRRWPEIDSE